MWYFIRRLGGLFSIRGKGLPTFLRGLFEAFDTVAILGMRHHMLAIVQNETSRDSGSG